MEFILIGVVSAFNLLFILMKLKRKRYEDAFFDTVLMFFIVYIFSGSYGGMVVAMVASLFVSISLFISPPTFTRGIRTWMDKVKEEIDELNGKKKTRRPNRFNL